MKSVSQNANAAERDYGQKQAAQQLVRPSVLRENAVIIVNKELAKQDINAPKVQAVVQIQITNAHAEHTLRKAQVLVQIAVRAGIRIQQARENARKLLAEIKQIKRECAVIRNVLKEPGHLKIQVYVQIVLQVNGVLKEIVQLVPKIAALENAAPETVQQELVEQVITAQEVQEVAKKMNAAVEHILELAQAIVHDAVRDIIKAAKQQPDVNPVLQVNIRIQQVLVNVHVVVRVLIKVVRADQVALNAVTVGTVLNVDQHVRIVQEQIIAEHIAERIAHVQSAGQDTNYQAELAFENLLVPVILGIETALYGHTPEVLADATVSGGALGEPAETCVTD